MPVKYDKSKVIRPETQILWTPKMVQSFARCMKDVHYFATEHCKVVHPIKGVIKLEPRSYQRRMLDLVSNNDMCVLNCPRQIGKCVVYESLVEVRCKKTGEIKKITIGEFFEKILK